MTTKVRGLDDVDQLLGQVAPKQAFNIMRATVHGMAGEVAKDARDFMPVDEGDMVASTKHKRENPSKSVGRLRSTVRVAGKAFYWRFLEYGDGPDGVAHGFFAAAVQNMRVNMTSRFLNQFGKKFEAALGRARKRHGG